MKTTVYAAAVLLLAMPIVAWTQAPPGATRPDVAAVVDANARFAADLHDQLGQERGNQLFSPYSISTALAMTYAGAGGQTEAQMAEVLHFDLPQERLHAAFAAIIADLNDEDRQGYQLVVANRLWGQQGYGFLPDFLATTRERYGAELAEVDFVGNTEQARQTINAWVEEQTQEKIKDLMARGVLNQLTRLVLTNAVYFKGNWKTQFDPNLTRDAPFMLSPGKRVMVPMMAQETRFNYAALPDAQLLQMPYAGDDLSMLVLLPTRVDGLTELEESLSAESLAEWTDRLRPAKVAVFLPRFKMTCQFQLNATLAAMGMPRAFDPAQADFSGINGRRDLYISAVIHKAFVDVNEEGTEAAAATGVAIGVTSVAQPPPLFRADHPFLFLIRDHRTDSILFVGRVTDPTPEAG